MANSREGVAFYILYSIYKSLTHSLSAQKERDIVFSLMRKSIDVEFSQPLSILSAFQRDSLPGIIYVEARSAKQVQQACGDLLGCIQVVEFSWCPSKKWSACCKLLSRIRHLHQGLASGFEYDVEGTPEILLK